jgi:hypothetical protein
MSDNVAGSIMQMYNDTKFCMMQGEVAYPVEQRSGIRQACSFKSYLYPYV